MVPILKGISVKREREKCKLKFERNHYSSGELQGLMKWEREKNKQFLFFVSLTERAK